MTLSEILSEALNQLGNSTDAQVKDTYKEQHTAYANDAQHDLARFIHQYRTDTLSIVDGVLDLSALPKECVKVSSVKKSSTSYSFTAGDDRTKINISGLTAGEVSVTYEYAPDDIVYDQDVPDLPSAMHKLIPVYIAARENMGKDIPRATALFEIYEKGKRQARSNVGGSDSFKIINIY